MQLPKLDVGQARTGMSAFRNNVWSSVGLEQLVKIWLLETACASVSPRLLTALCFQD